MIAPGSPPRVGPQALGAGGLPFRNDLNPQYLINEIKNRGYDVLWEKSTFCPNRLGGDIDRHDPNCPYCYKGRVYFDPQPIKALVSSINMQENYFLGGRWDQGNCRVTVLPENRLTYWDRLTLNTARVGFSEVIYRNKLLPYDTLKYNSLEVTKAFHVGPSGLEELHDGVDFAVEGRNVNWISKSVKPGEFYSVTYDRTPVYIVLDILSWVRQTPVMDQGVSVMRDLPMGAIAKLDFLIEDATTGTPKSGNEVEGF